MMHGWGLAALVLVASAWTLPPSLFAEDTDPDMTAQPAPVAEALTIDGRLAATVAPVGLQDVPARRALSWWSEQVGVALIINWDLLESEGFDPDTRITLVAESMDALTLLSALVSGFAGDRRMIIQTEPWYVMVMSQRQANRSTELRVYDLGALAITRPDRFGHAPRLSLRSILEQGDNGGGNDLFDDIEPVPTRPRAARLEDVIELIRSTIEPGIWQANGGEHSAIRRFGHRLLITAPTYVHLQIGQAVVPGRKATGDEQHHLRETPYRDAKVKPVSDINESRSPVSGVR